MEKISKKPIKIFILGTTASGKTRLSLDVGEHMKASILNTDVYSFYKGCSIMTAKAEPEEQLRVKHHCIDFLEMNNNSFNINLFREKALSLTSKLMSQDGGIVIVGGSNYYNEQLIFEPEELNQNLDYSDKIEAIFRFVSKGRQIDKLTNLKK